MVDNFKHDEAYYLLVLDLPTDFDESALKKAYRKKAMEWHPDKNPGDVYAEERLKLVNEAYEYFRKVKNFKSQNQGSKEGYKNQYEQEYKSDFTPWSPKDNNNNNSQLSQGQIEFIVWCGCGFLFYIYYKIVVG